MQVPLPISWRKPIDLFSGRDIPSHRAFFLPSEPSKMMGQAFVSGRVVTFRHKEKRIPATDSPGGESVSAKVTSTISLIGSLGTGLVHT